MRSELLIDQAFLKRMRRQQCEDMAADYLDANYLGQTLPVEHNVSATRDSYQFLTLPHGVPGFDRQVHTTLTVLVLDR